MYEQQFGLKKRPFLAKATGNNVFIGPQTAKTMSGLKKALVSKDAVVAVSGPPCEDYDFWLRLLIQMPIGLVEQKMVLKHGGHSDQLSTTTWGMDRFRVQALQKLLDRKDIEENRRTLLRETLIRKCKNPRARCPQEKQAGRGNFLC